MKTTFLFMRPALIAAVSLLVLFFSACTDKDDLYDPNWERPHCEFMFNTDDEYTVDVSYQNMGFTTAVYFEIYDQNPVSEGANGTLVRKEELSPLFGGYTELDGTFHGSMALPSYLNTVYIYTPAFYAQTVIKATVTGKAIVASDETVSNRSVSRAASAGTKYTSQTLNGVAIPGEAWKTHLGEFDESTGRVDGFYEPGTSAATYEVRLVSKDDYTLTWDWDWYQSGYYYIDPEIGKRVYVDKYYNQNGKENSKGKYYYRKISVTTTGEKTYHPGYNYQDNELLITNYQELYAVHASVINAKKDCPEIYRSSSDMLVGKDAEVAITLLGGNTCWNSSLGYYWYRDGQAPANYNEIKDKVVMLFPNTQDGYWSNNLSAASKCAGVERGTCVQLKYYSNINDASTGTTIFPAGTRIGFVLATNAWTNRVQGYGYTTDSKKYRAATSSGLSQDNSGNSYNAPRTAVYKYGDNIMVSFEDHIDDQNFSDVVFALKSNPIEAFTEIVDVTDTEITSKANKGMYSFEDIWPSEGDYDMNDVILSCNYAKTMPVKKTVTTDHNGNVISTEFSTPDKISREEYTIRTFQNYATYTDGISCIVELPSGVQVEEVKYYIKKRTSIVFEEFTPYQAWHQEDIYNKHGNLPYNQVNGGKYNVVHLVDNIRDFLDDSGVGAEFKIELVYAANSFSKQESVFKPFICIRNAGYFHEVHIPLEAPTNNMPLVGWNTYADASRPATIVKDGSGRGEFYVRANNITNHLYGPWYPFAIHFSGATETDLDPLLDKKNEGVPISELFPHYEGWVKSNNTLYTDWYKTTSR
ncbi:LruC domain-containing protein [Phocaeicola sp.]